MKCHWKSRSMTCDSVLYKRIAETAASMRLARYLASTDWTSGELPALGQNPRRWPPNDQRIVRLANRPHPRLVMELGPVRKQNPRGERIDEPRAGQSLLI